LAVRHYLWNYERLNELLLAVASESVGFSKLLFTHHPRHPPPPAAYLHYILKGLAKDRSQRYPSIGEMIRELHRIREGYCRVSCPATLARRMIGGAARFVDRNPKASPMVFFAMLFWLIFCVVVTTQKLLGP
jgi:hypothetical protein